MTVKNANLSGSVVFTWLGLLGAIAVIETFLSGSFARFFANWTLWFLVLLSIALGALFLIALEYVVSARWSVPLRRAPERVSSLLFLCSLLALVSLLGLSHLYSWAGAADEPLSGAKASWLTVRLFSLRTVLCFLIWALFFVSVVHRSLKHGLSPVPSFAVQAKRSSVVFLVLFAITISLISFDWLMSLDPHWYSTIVGVYLFSGSVVAGLAATTLMVLYLSKEGRLPGVKPDHLYNLGALLFGFNAFWAYIAFSQFMLIWYANLPEEVVFFTSRTEGPWLWVSIALALIHFVVPFFALLSRDSKSDEKRLLWVSVWLIASHALDLYWFIFPVLGAAPVFGWREIGFLFFFVALALVWLRRSLNWGQDMPVWDPHFKEGLSFRL